MTGMTVRRRSVNGTIVIGIPLAAGTGQAENCDKRQNDEKASHGNDIVLRVRKSTTLFAGKTRSIRFSLLAIDPPEIPNVNKPAGTLTKKSDDFFPPDEIDNEHGRPQ